MKLKNLLFNPLIIVFLIALLVRLYGLGQIPVGFHIDEVKAGWNALSILKTGKDDWGNPFPLYYNSFGDYRPTGYFYAIIPSLLIFGQNEFAVRFPAAFFGSLTVIILYFITLKLSSGNKKLSLLSSIFLAFSPWHISLSRASSEGIVALFLSLTGLYFLLLSLNSIRKLTLILSFLFFALSCFFYHVPKLLNPLIVLSVIAYAKGFKNSLSKKTLAIFFISICLVTVLLSINKEAQGRFSQVSIFSDLSIKFETDKLPFEEGTDHVLTARIFHNKLVLWGMRFINEYTQYFSSKFLLVPLEAKPIRYATVGMGVVSYVEFLAIILGLIAIIKGKFTSLPIILLAISAFPAALTTEDAPNLHRSLYMIPFFSIIASYGAFYLFQFKIRFIKALPYLASILLLLNFSYFFHMYFIHNPQRAPIPTSRNIGAKELAIKIGQLEKNYQKVLVTDTPDSIYPWYAFFTNKDPQTFNLAAGEKQDKSWNYQNVYFTSQRCPSRDAFKKNNDNILVVDGEGCESAAKYGPNVNVLVRLESYVYVLWVRTGPDVFEPDLH